MDQFRIVTFSFLFTLSLTIHAISAANDTIDASQSIRDGGTLVSSGDIFELGFFRPRESTSRYLGIWYKNIPVQTVVWVANRESPLRNNTGVLSFTASGNLALVDDTNGIIIWSSNTTRSVRNPVARLLDTGNLVVKDTNDDNIAWQSFDHPSDTLLPGMSVGWNYVTGVEIYFSSWSSDHDPSPGEFSIHLDPTGYPQIIFRRGNSTMNRRGPWNGVRFSGFPDTENDRVYTYRLWMNEKEVKFREDSVDPSVLSRTVVTPTGTAVRWVWSSKTQEWANYRTTATDNCDFRYNRCGAYGVCNPGNSQPCGCLDRFISRNPENWIGTGSSSGCERRIPLNCQSGDVFLRYSRIKLPDARNSTTNEQSMSISDCEAECLRNCDCTAYARLNISGEGSGCLFYHGDLIDIRTLSTAEQDLYIRMAAAERESKGRKRVVLTAILASVAGIVFVCIILFLFFTRRRKKDPRSVQEVAVSNLPLFSLSTILKATDHFSNNKKLGEGGCGPVYKGMLEDGQEIAVKRLSKTSTQGVTELKNEEILIAKLQHRNLVRTLGFCAEGKESMLIYEYLPNSSLDLIIFDETKSLQLDWQKRFQIINGIAKGLLYLHQDSRLRIIHRDLKASNILLDADMNPKISDFGLARSFEGNDTEARTSRVVGTYGYMSPEYSIDGLFSIKSDVFSFGVLVLEIVSGKRNRGFCLNNDHSLNLLGHAWTLYIEGISSDLASPCLGDSFDVSQVLRSIHVGLLCVQKSPEDRPDMSSVVFMLGNEVTLPEAKKPGFFTERDGFNNQTSNTSIVAISQNQITVTRMEGR